MLGSMVRSVPAAAFRGFTAGARPSASRSLFIFSKAFSGITISPRTSNSCGTPASFSCAAEILSGTLRMVRTLVVTSSPVCPSPRVSPRTSRAPPSGAAS